MEHISRGSDTNPNHLERWLGAAVVERVSEEMQDFYWPVAMHGVPGKVFVMPGGGFSGKIEAGEFSSAFDRADILLEKLKREERVRMFNRVNHPRFHKQHGAFTNLSAIIAAFTAGKGQQIQFQKTGPAVSAGIAYDYWTLAGQPVAGAAGAATPGGTAWSNSSTGALAGYKNGASTDSNHFTTCLMQSGGQATIMVYDRLFSVAKTASSSSTEAVTGVPSRGVNTTPGNVEYAGGNFAFVSVPTTQLASVAHNWTVCKYTNQGGTTGQSFPSIAGVAGATVHSLDLLSGNWFMPLAAGDMGLTAITQLQCSSASITGTADFVMGRPICIVPCPIANLFTIIDGINTAFNLVNVLDNACINFLCLPLPAAAIPTISGILTVVSE